MEKKTKKIMLFSAVAAAGAVATYCVATGLVMFKSGMAAEKKDNNLDSEEEGNEAPRFNSEYRKMARSYNIWWNSQRPQTVSIVSRDGLRLYGKLLEAKNYNGRVAVVCHGHRCCSGEEGFISQMFHEAGYHVLAIEQRSHGVSEGKFISMGVKEKDDAVLWTEYAANRYPESKIVLYGASMGAATVITANAERMPENVRCVIEDCGYTDTFGVFEQKMRIDYKYLPFRKCVVAVCSLTCRILQGFGLREYTPLEAARRAKLPMLVIHGQDDMVVPPYMGEEIYEAIPVKKKIMRVYGAGHNVSFSHAKDRYKETVFNFIEECFE